MTVKEKILKIMALVLEIEPTATRNVTFNYTTIFSRVLYIYVHDNASAKIVDRIEYHADHEDIFDSCDDIIRKLTELKNDMDAERQGET